MLGDDGESTGGGDEGGILRDSGCSCGPAAVLLSVFSQNSGAYIL
jgi:hypothetical protein